MKMHTGTAHDNHTFTTVARNILLLLLMMPDRGNFLVMERLHCSIYILWDIHTS
jgi:hypothetical protein